MTKRFSLFFGLTIVALLQIIIGYIWLQAVVSRNFSFGPAFVIMFGAIELIIGVIGMTVSKKPTS